MLTLGPLIHVSRVRCCRLARHNTPRSMHKDAHFRATNACTESEVLSLSLHNTPRSIHKDANFRVTNACAESEVLSLGPHNTPRSISQQSFLPLLDIIPVA